MRILILKPSSLGDVIHALPVLRMIRKALPEAEIHWWIDKSLAPLLEDDPDVGGTIIFDRQRWGNPANWNELFASVRGARRQRYDYVVDLQGLARSGLFAWFANGGVTIGLEEAREGSAAAYDLTASKPAHSEHAVDRYLGVLKFLDVPVSWEIDWIPVRHAAARAVQERLGSGGGRLIVLQPGARWLNKRWPVEFFGELSRELLRLHADARVVILGGKQDSELGHRIADGGGERYSDLTGKLTLPEMIELIRLSSLMITNDTGPMHVAAAVGIPVVALFGPTNPCRTGPYRQRDNVLQLMELSCVPCMSARCRHPRPLECLRAISPAKVLRVVEARLNAARALERSASVS